MSSRLLEFALNKKRDVSTEEGNVEVPNPSAEDADETDARLNAELAMMLGEEPPTKVPVQTNLQPKTTVHIGPYTTPVTNVPTKKKVNTDTNSMTDAEASVLALASNIKTEETQVDVNNNKTTTTSSPMVHFGTSSPSNGYTISMCPPTNRKFEQFFPPKSKEQLEREAANPPEPRGEDLSKPFKCEDCGVRLKAKTTLELHISSKHKGIKKFACTLCDHKSAQKANLIVHMKASHNMTEKFECSFCDFRIDGKRDIGNHVKEKHGRSIYGRGSEDAFKVVFVTFIEP